MCIQTAELIRTLELTLHPNQDWTLYEACADACVKFFGRIRCLREPDASIVSPLMFSSLDVGALSGLLGDGRAPASRAAWTLKSLQQVEAPPGSG